MTLLEKIIRAIDADAMLPDADPNRFANAVMAAERVLELMPDDQKGETIKDILMKGNHSLKSVFLNLA